MAGAPRPGPVIPQGQPQRPSSIVSLLVRDASYVSGPEVLAEMRRVIASGEVPPGSTIPLDEVAAFFGVSLIPVREALKTLLGEGLLEHQPRLGYTVTMLTSAELDEIYVVRGALEAAALDAAVSNATPQDDVIVGEIHASLGTAVATDDRRSFQHTSRAFHMAILAPCRMPRLLHMLDVAWNLTEPAQTMMRVTPEDRLGMQADHHEMLDAFMARDAVRLQRCARHHHARLTVCVAGVGDG